MQTLRLCFLFLALVLFASAVMADTLELQLSDPTGDEFNSGVVDLTGLLLGFDNTTGAYTITVTASAAKPFTGQVRLNLFFLNPDTPLGVDAGAFLIDNLNDFTLSTPTTSLVLTGVSSILTSWEAGDRVAINSTPFGSPSSPFFSGVGVGVPFPLVLGNDTFGSPGGANYGTITAAPSTPAAVPEPSSGFLFGGATALLGLGVHLRRRRALKVR
jgi:hypothetical protein